MKWVTVFADASYDHIAKAAGCGIWIRCDENIQRISLPITWKVRHSMEAETIALGCAILTALPLTVAGDRVSVQSDCLGALEMYTKGRKGSEDEKNFSVHVLSAVNHHGVTLHPKHVKGHMGKVSPRNAVNTFCDTAAKLAMRKARHILSTQRMRREDVLKEISAI